MLDPQLLRHYLRELKLDPLWIKRSGATLPTWITLLQTYALSSQSEHLAKSTSLPPINDQTDTLSKKKHSSANQSIEIIAAESNLSLKEIESAPALSERKEEKIINHNELEIAIRLQLYQAYHGTRQLLLAFLSPTLNSAISPFDHARYGRLLKSLLRQLDLQDLIYLEKQTDYTTLVSSQNLSGALLFSKSFVGSDLVRALEKADIKYQVLPHPLNLLYAPYLKKHLWELCWNFLNAPED